MSSSADLPSSTGHEKKGQNPTFVFDKGGFSQNFMRLENGPRRSASSSTIVIGI
jgi:hypothetical protein